MANFNTIPSNTNLTPGQTIMRRLDDSGWQGFTIPVTPAAVGLGNVNNTSDANKPISILTQAALDDKADIASLSTVAFTGDYGDLSNLPGLAAVATSGDYNDLTNLPSIPSAQVNSDWSASMGVTAILNKPTIPTLTSQLSNDSGFLTSAPVVSVAGKTGTVTLVKGDVGLGNVDNTTDLNKPISTATQTALNGKFPVPTGTTAEYVRGDGTLATLPTPAAMSFNNTPGRSIVTGTGATGFQVSSTRNSMVGYSVTVQAAVQIGVVTNVDGYIVLEIAPTNSATPGDWVEIARVTNSQNIGIALALSSTQKGGGRLGGIVPAGYYAKIRSVNVAGTPTYVYNSGQEVLV